MLCNRALSLSGMCFFFRSGSLKPSGSAARGGWCPQVRGDGGGRPGVLRPEGPRPPQYFLHNPGVPYPHHPTPPPAPSFPPPFEGACGHPLPRVVGLVALKALFKKRKRNLLFTCGIVLVFVCLPACLPGCACQVPAWHPAACPYCR